MPRTRSLAWAELKIGILAVVALVIAATLIFLLSGEQGFFWQQYNLKAVFTNIAGLKAGAPVRLAGVEVGTVNGVRFVGDRVEVSFSVAEDVHTRITSMSRATLGSVSLLGESAVDITPSSEGAPIPEWGYVPAAAAAGGIAGVADQANQLIAEIRSGQGTVGKLLTDDQLYRELTAFVAAADRVVEQINQGQGTLGRLVADPAAARALEASLQNLEAVTARIQSGEGSLGKLIADPALATSLTDTTANLRTLTGRLARGEGTLGQLTTDDAVYKQLSSLTNRIDALVASLQQGQGTVGQLLQDRQLYENMNAAVTELRSLVQDIRADPRRYLNVRVSLF